MGPLPLLRPPTTIVGGGGASAGTGFSTRVSSRQSQSQPSFLSPSAVLLASRGNNGHAPTATSVRPGSKPTRQVQPGVGRGSSALLVAADELPSVPQQQDQQHERQGLQVSTRVQRSSAAGRRAAAAPPALQGQDLDKADTSASTGDADTGRSTTISSASAQQALEGLPVELHCLLDASTATAVLPAPGTLDVAQLDNSRLDRLVAALGRGRATWRRALLLYDWLKASKHTLDDRLCTTLIRVCADHGDAVSALGVYEWMRAPAEAGGASLQPTAYTYTAAMRAALGVGMLDRAMQVWSDSQSANLTPDCRLCITYIEVCTKLGMADKALAMYTQMRDAPPGSPMRPSVHAYTAAMRAATEGGRWMRALGVWEDMRRSGCQPTGHAYAAAISACAAGQDWGRAVALFDDMTARAGIRPDVVSCTALVTALASAAEADKAEAVVAWMQNSGLKPNVRTYTALLTAMGNARQWQRAVRLLFAMQQPENGSVQPNAYTYSALLKALGENGQWQLAEAVFDDLEGQVRAGRLVEALGAGEETFQPRGTPRRSETGASSISWSTSGAKQDDVHSKGVVTAVAASPPTAAEVAQRAAAMNRLLAVAAAAEAAEAAAPVAAQAAALQQLGALGMLASGALGLQQLAALQAAGTAALLAPAELAPRQPSQPGWGYPPVALPAQEADAAMATALCPSGVPTPHQTITPVSAQTTHTSSVGSPMSTPSSATTPTSLASSSNGSGAQSVRNWSHPSQLNGIQLDLLRPATATPSQPTTSVTKQEPQHPAAGSIPPASPRPAGWLSDTPPELAAGHCTFSSSITEMATSAQAPPAAPADLRAAHSTAPEPPAAAPGFSLFSSQPLTRTAGQPLSAQTAANRPAGNAATPIAGPTAPSSSVVVNEVVCGALMLAYERAGKWADAVNVLNRARLLGVVPNTVMVNTAISAAGKAGQLEVAEQLFQSAASLDMGTYEAILAAYGMAGRSDKAEHMFRTMVRRGLRPRDYAYCGLITAHSMAGSVDAALAIRGRMRRDGYVVMPSVHVYNALLAACERAARYETALELLQAMKREGVEPNNVTHHLMSVVGRHGVETVESQQVAAAALSAVFAAAGGLLIRAGMW